MNYSKIYDNLIESRKDRDTIKGEMHHIVPRCMGGSDDESNLVMLTYREHFIAHVLLQKIYPKDKGVFRALKAMSILKKVTRVHSSRLYALVREKVCASVLDDPKVKELYDANVKLKDIAAMYGVTKARVSKYCIKKGWKRVGRVRVPKPTKEEFAKLYNAGASIKELSSTYNVTVPCICKWRDGFNLKKRYKSS